MDVITGLCWGCKKVLPNNFATISCGFCEVAVYCSKKCLYHDRFRHIVSQELKKMKNKKSLSGTENIKRWPYFSALTFIVPSLQAARTQFNLVECRLASSVLECSTCHSRSSGLKHCGACHLTVYCDKECQKLHWPRHKKNCKQFIDDCTDQYRNCKLPWKFVGDLPWYVGASMAEDYLQLPLNEGLDHSESLKLLFVGVGDIRDIIRTVTDLPQSFRTALNFILNDISPHVMARNILFLYCGLTRQNFSQFLPQIWYSFLLTKNAKMFLASILKSLTKQNCPAILSEMKGVLKISNNHWNSCKSIWKGWLQLMNDPNAVDRMKRTRHFQMNIFFLENMIPALLETTPSCHARALEDFIRNGMFLPLNSSERNETVFINSTMACFNPFNPRYAREYPDLSGRLSFDVLLNGISSADMVYCVRGDAFIFNCWDYLKVKETIPIKDDVLDMYNEYVAGIFQLFFDNVKRLGIRFRYIIDHFENLDRHLAPEERFDRICTSNLSDYFTFPHLLEKFGSRLNRNNEHSVLITHHQNWGILSLLKDEDELESFIPIMLEDLDERSEVLPGLSEQERLDAVRFHPICRHDYSNNDYYFFRSLIIEILHYYQRKRGTIQKSLVHPFEVAAKFDLRMRDFRIESNHVIPFRHESNIRRMSMAHCNKRHVEWIPRKTNSSS